MLPLHAHTQTHPVPLRACLIQSCGCSVIEDTERLREMRLIGIVTFFEHAQVGRVLCFSSSEAGGSKISLLLNYFGLKDKSRHPYEGPLGRHGESSHFSLIQHNTWLSPKLAPSQVLGSLNKLQPEATSTGSCFCAKTKPTYVLCMTRDRAWVCQRSQDKRVIEVLNTRGRGGRL